jgi:hypothetical protein
MPVTGLSDIDPRSLIGAGQVGLLTATGAYDVERYSWAYDCRKRQQQTHWMGEEVPLGADIKDWASDRVTDSELVIGAQPVGNLRVDLFERAGEGGTLQRFRAAVIEALDAALPCRPMQHVQVPLVDVGRQIEVDRLALAMNGARSAARSMIQRGSISKAVRNTAFSSSLRQSRCRTEPSCSMIDC